MNTVMDLLMAQEIMDELTCIAEERFVRCSNFDVEDYLTPEELVEYYQARKIVDGEAA